MGARRAGVTPRAAVLSSSVAVSLHHSPHPHPTDEEVRPTLAEVLDPRTRRLIDEAARAFGLAVHVFACDGAPLVGERPPSALVAAAAPELAAVELGAQRYRVRQLVIDGCAVGGLAVGPIAEADEPQRGGAALHLCRLVAELVAAGQERVEAARRNAALLEDADAELQGQNERLALAVRRLEDLDRIKSNFLSTVSHELRTPLTSVIGYSEMLLEGLAGPLNPEQADYVKTVMEKGEQLLSIIQGILDISRIEAGGLTLDRSRFDVADAIKSALSTVTPGARRKKLQLSSELPESLPPLYADRDKVRQILINLLGNAVKFTPEGGRVVVRAEVAALRRAQDEACAGSLRALRIAVVDSGIGIPVEAMARIFDPFFQVDGSSTREYGGTGLGLSIVKSFVSAHGGRVWAESSPGSGSTFFVTLPLAD